MIEANLKRLGVTLKAPAAPVANYVGFVVAGNMVYCSGQLPFDLRGEVMKGKVGQDATVEEAKLAAKMCAIGLVNLINAACEGDLTRVKRIVKLTGFINATPDFGGIPPIMNGASDLFVEVFGDKGKHARSTIGVAVLPLNAMVEVEAIVELNS